MKALRPYRPVIPRPFSFCINPNIKPKIFSTMPAKSNNNNNNNSRKEKKPQLTHFLCLPLVNATSLPQLETSFAAFKAAIPPSPHQHPNSRAPTQPLIPDGALRPIGTLHLTLGVMSLPTKERLDEALQFFHSLDLTTMAREAEAISMRPKNERGRLIPGSDTEGARVHTVDNTTPRPFTISLESLHALPRPRAATVLHAAPVDPTSRLYPFCEMLRNKFLEAGFLVGEYKESRNNGQESSQNQDIRSTNNSNDRPQCEEQAAENESMRLLHSESQAPKPLTRTPKPRPLLLHATVVNTIYVKGRRRGPNGGDRNHRTTRYSFDARDMLAHYRDYYLDSLRMKPRARQIGPLTPASGEGAEEKSGSENMNQTEGEVVQATDKYPFIWAREFPLESICICEMGAKKLQSDPDTDPTGMSHRLGEKYNIVSERSLDFGPT